MNPLQIAIVNSMNQHNEMVKNATTHNTITLVDHCGNVYTLHVWTNGETVSYLLESRQTPQALSNMFRDSLPTTNCDSLIDRIVSTRNYAKSIRIN